MLDIIFSFIICLAIPIVMFLGGILIKILKPKINWWFGYRSLTSTTNESIWNYVNQYFANIWIFLGGIQFILYGIITLFIYFQNKNIDGMICLVVIALQALVLAISLIFIEKNLNKKFDIKNCSRGH